MWIYEFIKYSAKLYYIFVKYTKYNTVFFNLLSFLTRDHLCAIDESLMIREKIRFCR